MGVIAERRARRVKEQVRLGRAVAGEDPPAPECTAATVRCASAKNMAAHTADCCRRHNVTVLRALAEQLDAAGVTWWIDYGTLLGYLINGGLYWNDKDTDIGVLAEHRDLVLGPIRRTLSQQRFHVTYTYPRPGRFSGGDRMKVRLSSVNHTNCDVFFWTPTPDGDLDRSNYISVDRYKGREFPAAWALPTTRGRWEGLDVPIPANPKALVRHRYGRAWRHLPAARTDGVPR